MDLAEAWVVAAKRAKATSIEATSSDSRFAWDKMHEARDAEAEAAAEFEAALSAAIK